VHYVTAGIFFALLAYMSVFSVYEKRREYDKAKSSKKQDVQGLWNCHGRLRDRHPDRWDQIGRRRDRIAEAHPDLRSNRTDFVRYFVAGERGIYPEG
jgi:hypothetical protein